MAAQGLSSKRSEVSGEAFWATKGRAQRHQDWCIECAQHLQYPFVPIVQAVFGLARAGAGLVYYVRKALGLEVTGIPPQDFITMCYYEQTFDNSKIQRVLGFYSKVPMSETLERAAKLRLQDEGQFYSWSQAGQLCVGAILILGGLYQSGTLKAASRLVRGA
eukprot:gnl/TRDRNA2_/TRDRNA2_53495_c0_seq1.p1 gnl/TRDRNA2_/TRDRNA2_53495_c0~~gnl/TRDRNA2_/TRDRNA2_53495_c0_seq1.p1  ORF type:complete len:173 (+),score=16.77 gnl/TRDRNA2_/TRDRNA2_53495_c0_seq1:34-519(+)